MTLKTLRLSEGNSQFAYRDHGVGEPLVLLHGVGMQSAAWEPQIEALAKHHRIIALDLPGHGQSAPLPAHSRLGDYVVWCHDVITRLNLGQVNIAGHSMGALIAAGYAITHPALLHRVALLNGVYRRDDASSAAVIARATAIREGQVDLEAPLSRWFADTPAEAGVRDQVATWLRAIDIDGYATAYTAFAHGDATYAGRFDKITCPFLALTGEDDPNSTPAMSRMMAKQAANGKAVVIKGHRHMVNLTAPAKVNAHLLAWLKLPTVTKELL